MRKQDLAEDAPFLCSGGLQAAATAGRFILRGNMADGSYILQFIYL